MPENKVVFGLKNVHYAKITAYTNGVPTYATPVAIPGAVNLALDIQTAENKFYADNSVYHSEYSNNGYSGDLEIARIPDTMLVDIWGAELDSTDKVLTESSNDNYAEFALLFQIDGDEDEELHVLYKCTASLPQIAASTIAEAKEPNSQTISLTATALADGKVRRRTTSATPSTVKAGWFEAVNL